MDNQRAVDAVATRRDEQRAALQLGSVDRRLQSRRVVAADLPRRLGRGVVAVALHALAMVMLVGLVRRKARPVETASLSYVVEGVDAVATRRWWGWRSRAETFTAAAPPSRHSPLLPAAVMPPDAVACVTVGALQR